MSFVRLLKWLYSCFVEWYWSLQLSELKIMSKCVVMLDHLFLSKIWLGSLSVEVEAINIKKTEERSVFYTCS